MRNQELLEAANAQIERLLEKLGVKHSKLGRWFSGPCPVHGGDNRNGFGFCEKGYWKCFTRGCEREYSSDIIGLVCGVQKCTYSDAVEWIAERLEDSPQVKKNIDLDDDRIYPEFCLKKLFKNDYYLKRGFSQATVDAFEHGLAESGDMLNRVVFPVRDSASKIRGFSGRWAGKEIEENGKIVQVSKSGKRVPKWKHTKFNKGLYLYNFHRAKDFCRNDLILVESIGNVMKWWDCGYKNCVACLGSSVSTTQFQIINATTKTLVLAFDNDKAGKAAEKRSRKQFEQYINVRTIFPPENRDWAEISNEELIRIYGTDIR